MCLFFFIWCANYCSPAGGIDEGFPTWSWFSMKSESLTSDQQVASEQMLVHIPPQTDWHGLGFHDGPCRSHGGSHGAPGRRLHSVAPWRDLRRSPHSERRGGNFPPRNTGLTTAWHHPGRGGQVGLELQEWWRVHLSFYFLRLPQSAESRELSGTSLTALFLFAFSIFCAGDPGDLPKSPQRKR